MAALRLVLAAALLATSSALLLPEARQVVAVSHGIRLRADALKAAGGREAFTNAAQAAMSELLAVPRTSIAVHMYGGSSPHEESRRRQQEASCPPAGPPPFLAALEELVSA